MTGPVFGPRSVYLPETETLVIADLHIGMAATSAIEGDVGERHDLASRLSTICTDVTPTTVVIAGDLLHAYDEIPTGASRTIDTIKTAIGTAEMIVTPGNHDQMLDIIAPNLESTPAYHLEDGTVICHGHTEPPTTGQRYIIGHDHPTLIVDGARHPCSLRGTDQYEDAEVIMLPAFSRLPRGTPVGERSTPDLASPLITDLGTCRPTIVADTVHTFPPLSELRNHL